MARLVTRGVRYQVVVHVDEVVLAAESEDGGSALASGSGPPGRRHVPQRIAAPMVGGLATSFLLELAVYPAVFGLWRGRGLGGAWSST